MAAPIPLDPPVISATGLEPMLVLKGPLVAAGVAVVVAAVELMFAVLE